MITFEQNCFHLTNGRVSYIIRLAAGKYPMLLHWGRAVRRVHDELTERFTGQKEERFSLNGLPLDALPQECPVFGLCDMREGMLQVRLPDGTEALDLCFDAYEIRKGKPAPDGLPSARGEEAETLILKLKDDLTALEAELYYTVYPDTDIIARRLRVVNGGKDSVTLEKALSASVDLIKSADTRLLTLSGAWGRERRPDIRPVTRGYAGVSSPRGASSLQTSPFMALLGPDADEDQGEVRAFALCYSGNFEAEARLDQYDTLRASIGILPFDFSWELEPGTYFDTPEAYLCYSAEGLNGMSRSFHRLVHRHITRGPFRNAARPILVNNWEATYFSFNEEKLLSLARAAKKADIDMLVLDDGWFGHRDSDNCSLGDWTDDLKKLPEGIKGLGEKLHELGLKFGLWFEPEMVSPDSELYRAHPDWCLHINGRPRTESRNQLTLDLSRQDVQDYIVSSVCAALKRGCVDYVKWDMNRNFTCLGSDLLPAGRMKELGHRYMLGLYSVLERIVSANPEVLFESCSSGGGRFDLGMLCFMPQTWTSDDTDAWERCRIQYATSYVMPPSAMGAHVSAVPNHQVGRVTPLFTRAAVAMGGTFGYELDLTKLPEEEMEEIRQINRNAHAWQSLLYYGNFIRLRSPYEGQETAWMSVSEDKKEALVTFVTGQTRANEKPGCLPLRGLDPDRDYRSEEDGRVFGGDELMYRGLPTDHRGGDYQARMVHLKAL